MRILITGGLGFIGSNLSKKLSANGYEIHVFDRRRVNKERYYRGDLNDYYSLENAFENAKPQVVIHLGAMVSRKESEETPDMAIATNASGTFHVCSLSLKYGSRLIYAGSSEEYGTALQSNIVVDESVPFGEPTSIYSMTKRMAEEIAQYFAHFKGLKATTMRLFMLYGPGEEPTDYRSAIARFTYNALTNRPLLVHANTERAWCHIDDAVDVMKLVVDRQQSSNYEVFNIGKDEPILTELLAKKIVELSDSLSNMVKIPIEATVIPVKRASFKKAKDLLGWEAKVPIENGLIGVIEWMREYVRYSKTC